MKLNFLLILLGVFILSEAGAQNLPINKNNIRFIEYPGFPEGNSTWGDIGYNPVNNTVYVGVTNHRDMIGFYEYTVEDEAMILKGFIDEMAHLREFQWQGKIHTKIVFDTEGNAYFGTDGGESRQEYLMNHPHGYSGGLIMKWDPKTDQLINLVMPMQYESIKDIDIDPDTGKIYAITYPQAHFIVFDPKTNNLEDLGRLASAHVPRKLFTDKWGNCYYVDWRQRLVKYEKSAGKLLFAKESLPSFPGTPGSHIITGITGYTKDINSGIIYFVTYGAKILAFHPREMGIGEVEDLGAAFNTINQPLWKPFIPNLNIGNNGKLYYVIGGHGNYVKQDTTVMMELDPHTKEKRIVLEFPITKVSEVTGANVRDNKGNLYFAGRKTYSNKIEDKTSLPSIDDAVSIPFMIKFNPVEKLE